jgi:heptosyltransferase-1
LHTGKTQLRVLIVRLGAMGDIVHALPAVTALREANPGWYLGWAIEPQWIELLCAGDCRTRGPHMPLVDRIHIAPSKRWAHSPLSTTTLADIRRVRRELRAQHYDVCVDLQGAVRSAWISRWARAPRLIGEAQPREALAKWFFTERVRTRGVHMIEQAAEVASRIAGPPLPLPLPLLPVDESASGFATGIAAPFVLLNPGAGWGAKRWPVGRYAVLARSLREAGYCIVINAGPGEDSIAHELSSMLRETSGVTVLHPTLAELIAITRRASLIVAGDTGPLHLASALGRPVVGIFGPTDPARNGPFGRSFRVLRHPASRRDHTRHAAPEAGLLTITPEEVLTAALELLQDQAE